MARVDGAKIQVLIVRVHFNAKILAEQSSSRLLSDSTPEARVPSATLSMTLEWVTLSESDQFTACVTFFT